MVHLRAARSLAGHHLAPVPTAEALVLTLLGQHGLALPLGLVLLHPAALVVRPGVVLGRRSFFIHCLQF